MEHGSYALTTFALALLAGLLVIFLSRKWRIPAIAPLLLAGVLLGPAGLGLIRPDALGEMLQLIVSVAVGLILFEGGLSLDLKAYKSSEKPIRRLLTVGVVTTWLVTAAGAWWLFELPHLCQRFCPIPLP